MRKRNRSFQVEKLEHRTMLDASDVVISEFLAVNEDSIRDEDGDRSDWLELHNTVGEPAELEGLILQAGSDRWTIPKVVLSPFETLVIFASGKDRNTGELHTNFQLSREGEKLALLTSDGVSAIHEYDPYPFQTPDVSYGIEMSVGRISTLLRSQATSQYLVPTREIGLDWTEAGFDDSNWTTGRTGIGYETSGSNYAPLLNSRVPSGTVGFYTRTSFDAPDLTSISQLSLNMKYDDGFIAYVNGQRVADSNGPASPTFQSTATGENSDGDAVVFEPFDISVAKSLLSRTGNVLAVHSLNRSTGSSDMLMMPEISFARPGESNTSEVGFFTASTPGGNNGQPIGGFTSEVTISLPHGFYDSPQQLTLSTEDTDATIRYTTDGSEPTSLSGSVYSGPIAIEQTTVFRAAAFKDDLVPARVVTASYFFVSDVVQQTRNSTLDEGFPSSWGGTSADYGLDPDVIGPNDDFGGTYADSIEDDLQAIPTLSIAIDVDDMFGSDGIYANPSNSNLEKAASLELIHPDGSDGFQVDAGLKIQGGAFRSFGLTKKKSFRFKFQSEYGAAKLEYPLFGDNAVDSFDTITLRMEANDGWQWSNGDNTNRLYSRDEWSRRTQIAMGQPGSHGTFGHVYINGVYWGTYNIVERPDEAFASDYIGGDKDDWDVQNSGRAINGDLQSWQELLRSAAGVDNAPDGSGQQVAAWMQMQGLNADGTDDPRFEDLLDVDNYIDYLIINMFGGNSDWPHKNYYAGRQRGPDSTGYKFFMWDAEWSLNLRSDVNTNRTNISDGIAAPYAALRSVPEFQLRFADRIQKHFSPGGALYVDATNSDWDPAHPERNVPAARFVEITDIVRSPLVAESARWGDQHGRPQTVEESWEPQVEFMLESYFPRRSSVVLRQFDRAGFMSDISTPEFSQQGGVASNVSLSNDEGQIFYTTDGSDPRLVGGDLSSSAIRYQGRGIAITGDTQIRMRALSNDEWSAINEAQFIAESEPATADNLAITEIHFNPQASQPGEPDEDNDEFEFIEVTNVGQSFIDLSGVRFVEVEADGDTDGIRFNFAPQTLAPGDSLVVVENIDAFDARYGNDVVIAAGQDLTIDTQGEYGGKLSNGGETITLVNAADQVIRQVTYDDWFEVTDGNGRSLEVTDGKEQRTESLSTESLWAASQSDGGTPGVFGVDQVFGDLNGDLRASRADVDLLYAAIDANENSPTLDLNDDGQIDNLDAQTLIVDVIGVTQGDVDFDGDVDFADFLAFSANFGKSNQTWFDGDFNGDGAISFEDMLLLSAFFGSTN